MSKLVVRSFAVSVDGYSAGLHQDLNNPIGDGGLALFNWQFATRTHHERSGQPGGETGMDDDFMARGFENIGAWIFGRNMFGPVRGPWAGAEWTGWWGDTPPYHVPVFVLTNHPRPPLVLKGGTTFHFVTEGIHAALEQALETANGQDVRLGGGVATVRQYLHAGLVDELHLAISPVLLGAGESIFDDIDLPALGYRCMQQVASAAATHVTISKEK